MTTPVTLDTLSLLDVFTDSPGNKNIYVKLEKVNGYNRCLDVLAGTVANYPDGDMVTPLGKCKVVVEPNT